MEKIHLSWLGQCYEILLDVFMWRQGLIPIGLAIIFLFAFIAAFGESKTTKKEIVEGIQGVLITYVGILFAFAFVIVAIYSVYHIYGSSKSKLEDIEAFKTIALDNQNDNIFSDADKIILNDAVEEILEDGKITDNEIRIYTNYSSELLNKRKEEKIFKEIKSGNLETPNEKQ